MSPILVRPVREQFEHDKVIRLLQARWRRRYHVGVNLGTDQSAPAGTGAQTVYPDLVLSAGTRVRKVQGVVEVETSESVNSLEAMAQWARFAALGVPLYLYVPSGSVDAARRLCAEHAIPVAEIWSYYSFGDQIRFTMIHRSEVTPAEQAARKRAAGSAGKKARAAKAPKAAASRRAPKKSAASGAGKPSRAARGTKGTAGSTKATRTAKAAKGTKNTSRRNTAASRTASGQRPRRAAAAAKRQPSRLVERQRSREGKRQPSRASAKRQQPPRSVKRPARAARQARQVAVSGRAQRRK